MATIYTNYNTSGAFITKQWDDTTLWNGGVVPGAADIAYVRSVRTTVNQSQFSKWVGTRTITVASTSSFAASGYFLTVSDQGRIVKVNYTGTTSTTFTGCTVDESANDLFGTGAISLPFDNSGNTTSYIPNGAYVHSPGFILKIDSGDTWSVQYVYLQEGGVLFVNGGILEINIALIVRDGRLIGRGSGAINIVRQPTAINSSNIGTLTAENYYMSVIDIDGAENRSHGHLTADSITGSGKVTVSMDYGSFAEGDEVAIYDEDLTRFRNRGYTGYRDASANFDEADEGFDVAGVDGNDVYLATRNGARGVIKSVTTSGSNKIIEVDPSSSYFELGESIIINNKVYTIDAIEDSEVVAYDYDFTNAATSLDDFWVDDASHVYSGGWNIEDGVGLRNTTGGYRELVHKYFWRREVTVEAYMSPLDGFTSGTRGTGDYAILTAYDPAFRWGHRGFDSFKSDYWIIDDGGDRLRPLARAMGNYSNFRLSRNTDLRDNYTRKASYYRVENRKLHSTWTIGGQEITKEIIRNGHFKGLVGLMNDGNSQFRCARLTLKIPTQRITIATTDSISVDSKVYRCYIEYPHLAGDKIVKISSVNTGDGNHADLAFAYRGGQRGNGQWPVITQINGVNSTNSSLPYVHNHDFNYDYYYDGGNVLGERTLTFDLTTEQSFTHISINPRTTDSATYYGLTGVTIYGSNDGTSWTTLYGPTDDTKKYFYRSYNRLGFYSIGSTVSYRYVKIGWVGTGASTNYHRYVNLGVHNFTGGYTLGTSNASDFNIGDTITVQTDNGWNVASMEQEGYFAAVDNSADPETFWHGGWKQECTIINKVGNLLYLDRPIWWGYIEGEDSATIVKTNRNFRIGGSVGNGISGWRFPDILTNTGSQPARIYGFKHCRFEYVGSYRYSTGDYTHGIRNYSYDYWNHANYDGISYVMGPDGGSWTGWFTYNGLAVLRNSLVMQSRSISLRYPASLSGSALFNNKMNGLYYGAYNGGSRTYAINFNEITTCDYGIVVNEIRSDRMTNPYFNEIRRNVIKGSSNYGLAINSETANSGQRIPWFRMEYNKVRGMDDLAEAGQRSGTPHIGADYFADHTGSRVSRYRNEGFISQDDVTSDFACLQPQLNFAKMGFDLGSGLYHAKVRYNNDSSQLRIYNYSGDDYYSFMGMELDILEDVEFQIQFGLNYKLSVLATMQNEGNGDGRLRVFNLQNGGIVSTQNGATPQASGTDWNTFNGTFTNFTATKGRAAIYFTRDSNSSWMDVKNCFARVLCDTPSAIKVVVNTFDHNYVWDAYGNNVGIKQLTTANARTLNINKIKF